MSLQVVDPIGDYNTDNGTSWAGWNGPALNAYSVGEVWLLLETGSPPSDFSPSGSHATHSRFLRVDEATGEYIAMASLTASDPENLYLWGPKCVDNVNGLVIATGEERVGSSRYCMIAWNLSDGTVAWETFWTAASDHIRHLICNESLGALYCVQQNGSSPFDWKLQEINLATGARTTKINYVTGQGYCPVLDAAGHVWADVDGGGTFPTLTKYLKEFVLTGTPSATIRDTIVRNASTGTNYPRRVVYDETNDRAWWQIDSTFDAPASVEMRRYSGGSVVTVSVPVQMAIYQNLPTNNHASKLGVWELYTRAVDDAGIRFSGFQLDLDDFTEITVVTEPYDTYPSSVDFQFFSTTERGWWRYTDTTTKFIIWTPGSAVRRRVSLCVIT